MRPCRGLDYEVVRDHCVEEQCERHVLVDGVVLVYVLVVVF